jgi:hypothetical protein
MFDFNEAPPVTDADLAVSIALAEEREEAIAAWLTATQEEEDHEEAVRAWVAASAFIEEADAQQDLRWACKG